MSTKKPSNTPKIATKWIPPNLKMHSQWEGGLATPKLKQVLTASSRQPLTMARLFNLTPTKKINSIIEEYYNFFIKFANRNY